MAPKQSTVGDDEIGAIVDRLLVALADTKHRNDHGAGKLQGRSWPTTDRRPWETTTEWCRRLDTYQYRVR